MMNAAGRANRPSVTPANQIIVNSADEGIACGNANSFDRPCCRNNCATTMRRMLNTLRRGTLQSGCG